MDNLWLFDRTRIAILRKLADCDAARGCDLRECLKAKKALMSYHLGILRDRGIVKESKKGRDKYYRIDGKKALLVKKILAVVG